MTRPTQRDHGTDAAYQRHRRQGTTPCQRCRDAVNDANRRRQIDNEEIEYRGRWVRDGLIWRPTDVA